MSNVTTENNQMQQTLGAHTAQIDIMLAEQKQLRADFDAVRADVHSIRLAMEGYMSSVKGGWKVVVIVGILITAILQAIGWIAEQVKR